MTKKNKPVDMNAADETMTVSFRQNMKKKLLPGVKYVEVTIEIATDLTDVDQALATARAQVTNINLKPTLTRVARW